MFVLWTNSTAAHCSCYHLSYLNPRKWSFLVFASSCWYVLLRVYFLLHSRCWQLYFQLRLEQLHRLVYFSLLSIPEMQEKLMYQSWEVTTNHNRMLIEAFDHSLTDGSRGCGKFLRSSAITFVQRFIFEWSDVYQRIFNTSLYVLFDFLVIHFAAFSKEVLALSIFAISDNNVI